MRHSMRNVLLAAATVGAVIAAAPAAHAAKPKKVRACTLATPGQVQIVTGVEMGSGKPEKMPAPAGLATEQCSFQGKGEAAAFLIIGVSQGRLASLSFNEGRKTLDVKPLAGIGTKAWVAPESGEVGFLYKNVYVIVQPPLGEYAGLDRSKVPDLAKVVFQSLKSKV